MESPKIVLTFDTGRDGGAVREREYPKASYRRINRLVYNLVDRGYWVGAQLWDPSGEHPTRTWGEL